MSRSLKHRLSAHAGAAASLAAALVSGACERAPAQTAAPLGEPAAEPCPLREALADTWTEDRRARLSERFAELPGEWPAQLLDSVEARVEARAQAWSSAAERACALPDPSAQRCLERELAELDAALTLSYEQPRWAEHLWPAFDLALGELDACADAGATQPVSELAPEDAQAWIRLALERRHLEAQARASALGARVEQLRGQPAEPRQAFELGAAEAVIASAGGDEAAREAKLVELAALAEALGPAGVVEHLQLRAELSASPAAAERALAAARELDEPWALLTSLHALGRAQLGARDYEAALAPLTEAIALSSRLAGAQSPRVAQIQLTLAEVLTAKGKIEAAYDLLTQARDSFIIELGPDHPVTLASVESIGRLFMAAGQPGDAQYAYLDLLDVYDQLYGAKHWRVARVKLELGDSLMAMEQFEGARTMYAEALTPLVQELGADARAVIRASIHLGVAELRLESLDQAETHCARGLNLVKALPDDDPLAAEAQACVDELALARKQTKKNKRPK